MVTLAGACQDPEDQNHPAHGCIRGRVTTRRNLFEVGECSWATCTQGSPADGTTLGLGTESRWDSTEAVRRRIPLGFSKCGSTDLELIEIIQPRRPDPQPAPIDTSQSIRHVRVRPNHQGCSAQPGWRLN